MIKKRIMINKKSYAVRMTAIAMAMMLGLTGCGKKEEKAPELLEPVTTNEAYRPVEKSDVGKKIIKNGAIVPTDYCYFFKTSATLSKIYVNVGDYVKKGTVLAEADSDDTTSGIEDLKASLSSEQQTHNVKEKIYEQTQKELDYKIKACNEAGDSDGAKENQSTKAVNAENNRYDNMLYNYKIKKIQQQIDEKESLETDNKLVAEQDGYVTYAKSLTDTDSSDEGGGSISSGENVVIISDYNTPYIEITGEQITRDGYANFNTMYTMIDGKRYELEEYKYSNQEIAAAQSASKLPYVRFKLKDVDNSKILKTGTLTPLYFSTSTAANVLVVGNDSLYEEGDKYFVYVKTDSSDKEKREIKIGAQDDNYTEVKSGLSEGDLVYYDSDSTIPSDYTTYEIKLGTFKTTGTSKSYKMVDTNQITYKAPVEGYFTQLDLAEGQEVKKGDLLYIVDSGGGSAELLELNSQISDAKSDYDSTVAGYEEQIKDLRAEIEDYRSGRKKQQVATPGDADPADDTTDTTTDDGDEEDDDYDIPDPDDNNGNTLYMVEQLTCQIEIAKYNEDLAKINYNTTVNPLIAKRDKLNKNNDGKGNISVYAESDGVVQSVYASQGKQIKEGDKVVSIGSNESKMMSLSLTDNGGSSRRNGYSGSDDTGSDNSNATLLVNQEVTLIDQKDDSKKLTGRCIGATADSKKAYVTTIDGQVYITSSSGSEDTRYYIQVDDKSFYDSPKGYFVSFAKMSLENVVTVPMNIIYTETDKTSGKSYEYVWKLSKDEIVKQYVTTSTDTKSSNACVLTGLSEGDVILKESGSSGSGDKTKKKADSSSEE